MEVELFESVAQSVSSESDQPSPSSSSSTPLQVPSPSVSLGTSPESFGLVPHASSSASVQPSLSESASEIVQDAVPQPSPVLSPFPLTKLTARLNVTLPEPLLGEVQLTIHDLELEFECVTSPDDSCTLLPGSENEP